MLTSTIFTTKADVSTLLGLGDVNVTEVSPTEYTQNGNGRFLAYIPSRWKNYPRLVRVGGGGARRPPFHYIYHHVQSCSVCSSWEGRYTPPISYLPPYVLCGFIFRYLVERTLPSVQKLLVKNNKLINLSQKLHYSDKLFKPIHTKKESLFCTGFKTEFFSYAGIVAKSWQNMANWRMQNNLLSFLKLK